MTFANTPLPPFPLGADDTHRTETFGPLFEFLDSTTYEQRLAMTAAVTDADYEVERRIERYQANLDRYTDAGIESLEKRRESDPSGRSPHSPGAKLDAGKVRPGLVLGGFARALLEVSKVGTYGATKYTDNGWMEVANGQARYADAQLRHWLKMCTGEKVDPDTQIVHLAHEAWNALAKLDLYLREQEATSVKAPHA